MTRLHVAVHHFPPGPSFRSWRSAIVETRDDVPFIGERAMKYPIPRVPSVYHRLSGGLSVYIDKERIFLRRVEVFRLYQPTANRDSGADIDTKGISGTMDQILRTYAQFGIVLQHALRLVIGQAYELGHLKRIEGRIGVNCPAHIR